jgi:hypothetical protein
MNGVLTNSVRDKMIIMAITWIATLGMIIVAIFAYAAKYTEALAVLTAVGQVTGLLGTAYRGNPSYSPVAPTTTMQQGAAENTTQESVSDQKGQENGREKSQKQEG